MKPDRPLLVVFYKTDVGNEPVRQWLLSLTKNERKKIGEDILTVQFGWPLGMPLVERLEPGLWEIRIRLKNKIARVIFTMRHEYIILLHGFIKKTQRISQQDLCLARRRMKDVKGDMS